MARLSPKYIALALNAYVDWEGAGERAEEALLDCAASRVLQMRDDPVTEYTFPSQVGCPPSLHLRYCVCELGQGLVGCVAMLFVGLRLVARFAVQVFPEPSLPPKLDTSETCCRECHDFRAMPR